MIGKSKGARIILLVVAIILLLLLWGHGVSSDIMIGAIALVVIRILALLFKASSDTNTSDTKNQ